jgi:DNA-binding MarR family transcriptional regulator
MEFTVTDRILSNLNYNLNFSLMLFAQFPLDNLDLKISRQHIPIIHILELAGPMSMTRIARTLMLPNSRTTYQVDALVKLGIIERLPDSKDRRKINIGLTQKGRAINDACKKVVREGFEEKVSGLSEEELEEFADSLDRIREIGNRIFPNTGLQAQVL